MSLLLDIIGAFIMAIMIGLGWYAWKQDMHITFVCYWGMLCFINGIFDMVKLIDHLVKSPVPLFSHETPPVYNLMSFIFLSIPVSTLLGVPLAWCLYKNYTEGDVIDMPTGGYYQGPEPEERQPLLQGPSQFRAFQGPGQRLGVD